MQGCQHEFLPHFLDFKKTQLMQQDSADHKDNQGVGHNLLAAHTSTVHENKGQRRATWLATKTD